MVLGSPVRILRLMKAEEPRTEKLTALVTKSMMADVRALRLATMESTGDMINRLVAQELAEHAVEVREGRRLLTAQEARRERTEKARRTTGEQREASPDPEPEAPTLPLVQDRLIELARRLPEWAELAEGDIRSRRKRYGLRFIEWCRAEGREGRLDDLPAWSEVMELETGHQTVKNARSVAKRYLEWFDGQ